MSPIFLLPLGSIEDIAPFLTLALFAMVPIMAILTKHQQKMAMILRDSRQAVGPTETETRILQELGSLREIVNQQAIVIDDIAASRAATSETDEAVRQRIRR